jgi:hypothetical protein
MTTFSEMLSRVESNLAIVGSYAVARPSRDSEHSGIAFLFGNENYQTLKDLPKVKFDLEFMENALTGLKFKVHTFSDLTQTKMLKRIVNKILEADLSAYTCLLFYFSGHGSNGNICGTDGMKINIMEHVITPIGLKRSLRKKPKLFFFDCCRTKTVEARSEFPLSPNIYVAYATSPYHPSYDGEWSEFLALALLESCYPNSDRWISSIHNVLTFARVKTFEEHQSLTVSGEDTLMKLLLFKDFIVEPNHERLAEQLHGHYLCRHNRVKSRLKSSDKGKKSKAQRKCDVCGESISSDSEYFSCAEGCDYHACSGCIVNFECWGDKDSDQTHENLAKKHEEIKKRAKLKQKSAHERRESDESAIRESSHEEVSHDQLAEKKSKKMIKPRAIRETDDSDESRGESEDSSSESEDSSSESEDR